MNGLDGIKQFTVIVESGSGCLFQPLTDDYSYILTSKHLIKEHITEGVITWQRPTHPQNKNERTSIEFLYRHPQRDAAIIKIPKLESLPPLKIMDNPLRLYKIQSVYLGGHPKARRNLLDSFRSDPVTVLNSRIKGRIEAMIPGNPKLSEVQGMSGGGIIEIRSNEYWLAGIQKQMVAIDKNEQLGRIEFMPLSFFEEIISKNDELADLYSPIVTDNKQLVNELKGIFEVIVEPTDCIKAIALIKSIKLKYKNLGWDNNFHLREELFENLEKEITLFQSICLHKSKITGEKLEVIQNLIGELRGLS